MSLLAGFGKTEIIFPEFNIGMMGYGNPKNKALTQATPIYSRSLCIKENHKIVILNVVELCFISIALKNAVVESLRKTLPEYSWQNDNVLLSAQHTHSAPGGFSHYPMWNFTIPGFRPKTFEAIKNAIVSSIVEAYKKCTEVNISHGLVNIDKNIPIAFNRSMKAVRNNPEFSENLFDAENFIDRTVNQLIFKDTSDKLLGCVNLFGVHCTSVSNRNTKIHSDNKGIAATLWEQEHEETVALFAQSTAGDISPNYIFDKKTGEMRGPSIDGIINAEINGKLQFEASQKINSQLIKVKIHQTLHHFKDFATNCCPAAHGVAFTEGTLDGLGIPKIIGYILKKYLKISQWIQSYNPKHKKFLDRQKPKAILLDHREEKFLSISYSIFKYLKFFPDPIVSEIAKQTANNALNTHPWVPSHLPIQLIHLGSIVIIGVPGEITTVAGHRLKKSLQKFFPESHLLLWSYCNAYMGYITTPEEYDIQCYEGGHTIFGRNSLDYLITCFEELALGKLGEETPLRFNPEELALRSYIL